MMKLYLLEAPSWKPVDQERLVYLFVIAGLVVSIGESKKISQEYIKLVMNLDKVKSYPWGIVAFDHLLNSIIERRNGLKKASYVLDGFTYALQVWAMEAIPLLGNLCGQKINSEITEARCSNWTGSAKLSWDQIIEIEDTFKEHDIAYPYISSTGNYDVLDSIAYLRDDEIKDKRVDNLNSLIRFGYDFKNHIWASLQDDDVDNGKIQDVQVEESVRDEDNEMSDVGSNGKTQATTVDRSTSQKRKKNHVVMGVESRKRRLLYECASTSHAHTVQE